MAKRVRIENKEFVARLQRAVAAGQTPQQFADTYGYKTPQSVLQRISQLRGKMEESGKFTAEMIDKVVPQFPSAGTGSRKQDESYWADWAGELESQLADESEGEGENSAETETADTASE